MSEAKTRLGAATTAQAAAQAEYSDAVASVNQALSGEEALGDVRPSPDGGEATASSAPGEPLSTDSTEAYESDGPSDHPGTPEAEADVQTAVDVNGGRGVQIGDGTINGSISARTTMRYDRARGSLDRHATYIVAAYLAGAAR